MVEVAVDFSDHGEAGTFQSYSVGKEHLDNEVGTWREGASWGKSPLERGARGQDGNIGVVGQEQGTVQMWSHLGRVSDDILAERVISPLIGHSARRSGIWKRQSQAQTHLGASTTTTIERRLAFCPASSVHLQPRRPTTSLASPCPSTLSTLLDTKCAPKRSRRLRAGVLPAAGWEPAATHRATPDPSMPTTSDIARHQWPDRCLPCHHRSVRYASCR